MATLKRMCSLLSLSLLTQADIKIKGIPAACLFNYAAKLFFEFIQYPVLLDLLFMLQIYNISIYRDHPQIASDMKFPNMKYTENWGLKDHLQLKVK